ncbi:RNA polymerase sigma-70 factor [Hymenobacter profundi]|uniref:RNA polymerase sigma-70 factor n=1 Tax=Hymenobacter profundi TaxID=1982110 RepID=A0ABS6X5V2_9BACT|nr:RNA polymerase sigma-70 factor [Hymenobacter profundi]MBW3131059.1 RNA polymerase sigma-70 factor [Hymenobacter profundi]
MTYATSSSDQQLLAALALGNEAAFDALFARHYAGLLRYAISLLPYPTDAAEDVTADVFCTLWTNRAQLAVQGSVAAYLYTAVRHRSFDRLRQQRRTAQEITVIDELPPHQPEAAYLRPDEQLAYQELHQRLHQLIGQLPARTHQVFQLHRDAGLTYEEIADLLDISLNSVKTHMFRALRFLKEALHVSGVR